MSESMATGWYSLHRATGVDQQVGPLSWEQRYGVAAAGTLQAHELVWHPALPQWTPDAQIQGLIPAPPPPSYEPAAAYAPAMLATSLLHELWKLRPDRFCHG